MAHADQGGQNALGGVCSPRMDPKVTKIVTECRSQALSAYPVHAPPPAKKKRKPFIYNCLYDMRYISVGLGMPIA